MTDSLLVSIARLERALLRALGKKWLSRRLLEQFGSPAREFRFDSLLRLYKRDGVISFDEAELVIAHYAETSRRAARFGIAQPIWALQHAWLRHDLIRRGLLRRPTALPIKLAMMSEFSKRRRAAGHRV